MSNRAFHCHGWMKSVKVPEESHHDQHGEKQRPDNVLPLRMTVLKTERCQLLHHRRCHQVAPAHDDLAGVHGAHDRRHRCLSLALLLFGGCNVEHLSGIEEGGQDFADCRARRGRHAWRDGAQKCRFVAWNLRRVKSPGLSLPEEGHTFFRDIWEVPGSDGSDLLQRAREESWRQHPPHQSQLGRCSTIRRRDRLDGLQERCCRSPAFAGGRRVDFIDRRDRGSGLLPGGLRQSPVLVRNRPLGHQRGTRDLSCSHRGRIESHGKYPNQEGNQAHCVGD